MLLGGNSTPEQQKLEMFRHRYSQYQSIFKEFLRGKKLSDIFGEIRNPIFAQMVYHMLCFYKDNDAQGELKVRMETELKEIREFMLMSVRNITNSYNSRANILLNGGEIDTLVRPPVFDEGIHIDDVMQYFGYARPKEIQNAPKPSLANSVTLVCENEPWVRAMLHLLVGRMECRTHKTSLDTTKSIAEEPERIETENVLLEDVNLLFTDINDDNDIDDISGGLRRGMKVLVKGGFVVFLSGYHGHEEKFKDKIPPEYHDKYIFVQKPIENIKVFYDRVKELVEGGGG